MPWAPPRPCRHPGCGALSHEARCEKHRREKRRQADAKRPGSTARGYGYRWQKASKAYLREHPLCELCFACGVTEASEVVHHKIPHRGDPELFWDRSNWQALSKVCHDRETGQEDGTFGRQRED